MSPLTFSVDFNDVRDGVTATLRRFASDSREPTIGQRVRLSDGEGNACWGRVDRFKEDQLVYLKVDWDSWDPADYSVPS